MKIFIYVILLFANFNCVAQSKIDRLKAETVAEGKLLYASEMASWYGTDLFMANYADRSKIGGYFSYIDKSVPKCIFFSNDPTAKVLGTIAFDESYSIRTATVDLAERDFTAVEADLHNIRQQAMAEINANSIFKLYENTNFNLIPLLSKGEKKVYVLTGPTKNGVVIFGNDYLMTFGSNNRLLKTTQLHANIITVEYGNDAKQIAAAIHSHLPTTGDIMTATDICTTMLYQKFTGWESTYVISQNYVSIWNCKSNELAVMTRKAFEKIGK